ncbi:MAG: beta-ketoacyl-[acyl-carrier-protein] synthase family protein [Candidatus Omnitrophota bacterium]
MIKNRVVITGIGVVSPIGIGRASFWKALTEGKSGIKPVSLFDTSKVGSKLAGEIGNFVPEEILGQKALRNLDRTTLLGLCAAKLCLDDAHFQVNEENANDVGVVLGSTMGGVWSINEFDKEGVRNGPRSVNPALFPNTVMNAPASQISIRFGIKGFNTTISTGFTSSLEALEYAKQFIALNRASSVLVGGVEELCEQTYKGCYKLKFLSGSKEEHSELCAPFDRRRNGAVLGEGSVMFLLENYESAKKRNAKIYAELKGVGSAYDEDSFYRYNIKVVGAKRAIERALQESDIALEDIDYVASGANSTLDGDVAESRALQFTLGMVQKNVVASSSKSMIGETFSAGGAFQVATGLLSLDQRVIPPTINFEKKDIRCQVDCVPNEARQAKIRNVLVTNLSPMGQNAAAVLSKDSL